MKVSDDIWKQKMQNLNDRRAKETIKNSVPGVDNYCEHLSKIKVGESVLDVGAGGGMLKNCLSSDSIYLGIDPFPQSEAVLKTTIEDFESPVGFDTVVMFAALDNVIDFKKTIQKIKTLAKRNVLFLTGVNIEPDQYHTIKITEAELTEEMKPFRVGYIKYLHPKIVLVEFIK